MKRRRLVWVCSRCGRRQPNVSSDPERWRLPAGWRREPVLCGECNAARYRELGRRGRGPVASAVERGRDGPGLVARPRRRVGAAAARAEAELRRDPVRPNPQVAVAAGVSKATVARTRRRLEAEGAIPVVERALDSSGRSQPLRRGAAR